MSTTISRTPWSALIDEGPGGVPPGTTIDKARLATVFLDPIDAALATSEALVRPVAAGGTGLASYAVGDLLYASGATTLAKLADVAVGSYLRSGGITTAPLWSTLTLPNAATTGDLFVATGANVMGVVAGVAVGQVLTSGGVGAVPVWTPSPSLSTLRLGTNPATTGALRLAMTGYVYTRNTGNSANLFTFGYDTDATLNIGDTNVAVIPGGTINTQDLGSVSHTWRNGYFGNQIFVGDGDAANPSLTFGSRPDFGWYQRASAARMSLAQGGFVDVELWSDGVFITTGARFGWGAAGPDGAIDTAFSKLGAGSLALGNGTAGDVTGALKLTNVSVLGYHEGTEIATPAAGAVNTGRIYFDDNGSGKTRLMCLFNTGAAQVVAIQP